MNRRDFLQSSASAAVVVATTLRAAPSTLPPRKFTVALTPGSVGVSVKNQRELNELAHRHRFEAVEPRVDELARLSDDDLDAVVADLKTKGLVWAAAGLPVDFRKDDAAFRDGVSKLARTASALQRAGVQRVGTWLSPSHDSLTYRANFQQHVARLREVAQILNDHGLRLGLEYVGTQLLLVGKRYPFVHTMAEARELISEIGGRNVGLVLDSWHWTMAGDTEADLLALKNSDVVSVDLNDAPKNVPKPLQKDGERELPVATGVIDAATFLNALVKIGYDGPIRAEPFNKELNALDNDPACAAVSAAMHKAMALIRAAASSG